MSMLALNFFLLGSLADTPSVLDQLRAVITGEPLVANEELETVDTTDERRLAEEHEESLPPTELTLEDDEDIPEERRRAISRDVHGNTWSSICQLNGCCKQEIRCKSGQSAWRRCCGCKSNPRWPSLKCRGGSPSPSPTHCRPRATSSIDGNGNSVKREVKRNCCVTITVRDRRGNWRSNTACGEEPRVPTLWSGRRLEGNEAEDQATELEAPVPDAELQRRRSGSPMHGWDHSGRYRLISFGSCADNGMVPIVDRNECERAAGNLPLGYRFGSLSTTKHTPRPEGCYWYRNSELWLSTNYRNKGRGAETSTFNHKRSPICKRRHGHECGGWGAKGPRSWPLAKANWCCLNMRRGCEYASVGGRRREVVDEGVELQDEGVELQAPAADLVADLEAPVAEFRREEFVSHNGEFQILTWGSCRGRGMKPLGTKHECERAARTLRLSDQWAQENWRDSHRPEGCYLYMGQELWFASNSGTRGRGAETGRDWKTRHPICKKTAYNCVEGWGAQDPQFWSTEKRRWCCDNRGTGCGFGGLHLSSGGAPHAASFEVEELDQESDSGDFETEEFDGSTSDSDDFETEEFDDQESGLRRDSELSDGFGSLRNAEEPDAEGFETEELDQESDSDDFDTEEFDEQEFDDEKFDEQEFDDEDFDDEEFDEQDDFESE